MNLNNYQEWARSFYKKRSWYDYSPFIRCNFLSEEVGELAQAVRKKEIGRRRPDERDEKDEVNLEHLKEELGDVLDNVVILADIYGFSLEEIMEAHKEKLEKRFQ